MKRVLDGLLFGLGFAVGFAAIQFLVGLSGWLATFALGVILR